MKFYIRAAIAKFMISGPCTVLPALPSRPETQATGSKITECAAKKQDEPQSKVTQDKVSQAKTTWASITRNGLKTPPALQKSRRLCQRRKTRRGHQKTQPSQRNQSPKMNACFFAVEMNIPGEHYHRLVLERLWRKFSKFLKPTLIMYTVFQLASQLDPKTKNYAP
ncbi:EKA-like protein [Blumeria hordei DH14]|uniref:EKA-like protein n=1 Tax=Blumeria graminis f. sp. hordei (strain DH14) TaxID=546991 RepID=N1JPJ8_BLUG1|nr:EKA-like protein [Blumeria hordei DH14]